MFYNNPAKAQNFEIAPLQDDNELCQHCFMGNIGIQ